MLQLDEAKISVWYLKINNDASYCKFGKMFNGKDRFISGMQEGFVLNTSFEKNMKVCPSKELLDIALNIEAGFTYEHENIYFTILFTTTSSRDGVVCFHAVIIILANANLNLVNVIYVR